MYRLIVSDLDGTLLDPGHRLSDETRTTIIALQQQGVKFCIATGRHFEDVKVIADEFPFPMFLITCNGARVHNRERQVIYRQDIPADMVDKIVKISRDHDVHRNIYDDQCWYVEQPNAEIEAFNHQSGFFYQQTDFTRLSMSNVCKLFFWGEHATLEVLQTALLETFSSQLNITFSLPCCLEVMLNSATKGEALKAVLAQKGIDAEHSIAFGDGMNDREMLTLVGKGVIMGNAHDKLKSALPHHEHALSNGENGVAKYLQAIYQL